jgi:hypothetical protein
MPRRGSRKDDRRMLLGLAKTLGISQRRIKRDGCDDWIIGGRRGHIATDGVSFYAYVRGRSPRHWNAAKRILRFLSVSLDGDEEGIFNFCETQTGEQAAQIRKVLGIRKAPQLTQQQRSSRRSNLAPKNGAVSSEIIGVGTASATRPTEQPKNAKNRTNF